MDKYQQTRQKFKMDFKVRKPKNESLPAIKNYNTERKLTSRKLTINPETSP